MFIQFDKNQVHVQVICGTLETYTPKDEVKAIQEKVTLLREKIQNFMSEHVTSELELIQKMVDEENSKNNPKTEEK